MGNAPKRTVVIEMTEEAYRALAQEALSGGLTLAELLIGHAFATCLNSHALEANMERWLQLLAAWRSQDPEAMPGLNIEHLTGSLPR